MSTTMDEKYARLIRALIMPRTWYFGQNIEIPYEDREKILEAGIKRFDEIFTQNEVLRAAHGAAEQAMRVTAKKLWDKRLKALERMAPKIQAKIRDLIQDKKPGFDLGYQVADALKAEGYTWQQVILAKRDMRLPAEIDGGIQIGYTGIYD